HASSLPDCPSSSSSVGLVVIPRAALMVHSLWGDSHLRWLSVQLEETHSQLVCMAMVKNPNRKNTGPVRPTAIHFVRDTRLRHSRPTLEECRHADRLPAHRRCQPRLGSPRRPGLPGNPGGHTP